jgi:plastocyanin
MDTPVNSSLKITLIVAIILLGGCASIYSVSDKIPGLDRLINHFSKAEVGPVQTQEGEIVQGTETGIVLVEQQEQSPKASLPEEATIPVKSTAPTVQKPIEVSTPKAETPILLADLYGKVTLLANAEKISPEGVIVRLKRADGTVINSEASATVHDMDMIDKTYTPGNMVINKGDTLNFVNKDEIQHNVFSSTGENAFDLGTFGSGLQRAVKLNEDGIVKVYCNIHPNMAAYVAVDEDGISQVINSQDGEFEFTNLPDGEYILSLWSIRGQQSQTITIANNKDLSLNINFDTSAYQTPERVNKFGEQYENKRKATREFF